MRKRVISIAVSLLISATLVFTVPLVVNGKKVNDDVITKDSVQYVLLFNV